MNSVWLSVIPEGIISCSMHLERTGSLCATVPMPLISHTSLFATRIYTVWKMVLFHRKECVAGTCLAVQPDGTHQALCWKAFLSQIALNLPIEDFSHGGHPEEWEFPQWGPSPGLCYCLTINFCSPQWLNAFTVWWCCITSWSRWRCEWVGVRSCHSRTCCVWGCESSSFWGFCKVYRIQSSPAQQVGSWNRFIIAFGWDCPSSPYFIVFVLWLLIRCEISVCVRCVTGNDLVSLENTWCAMWNLNGWCLHISCSEAERVCK